MKMTGDGHLTGLNWDAEEPFPNQPERMEEAATEGAVWWENPKGTYRLLEHRVGIRGDQGWVKKGGIGFKPMGLHVLNPAFSTLLLRSEANHSTPQSGSWTDAPRLCGKALCFPEMHACCVPLPGI